MIQTRRLFRWILAGMLCGGGCVTQPWVEFPPGAASHGEPRQGAQRAASVPIDSGPEGDRLDAEAISQAAQKSGIPADEAARLATFLDAYAEMGRYTSSTADGQALWGTGTDVIPVSAAEAVGAGSSPAAVARQGSEARSPAASGLSGSPPSGRGPTSVYGTDRASGGRREPAPPAPTVTVGLQGAAASSTPAGPRLDETHRFTPGEPARDPGAADEPHQADLGGLVEQSAAEASVTDPDATRVSWSRQVRSAMEQLRHELADTDLDDEQRARSQVCLGLLHLALDDPEKAVEAIRDLDGQQLEFWRQTVMGLGILLDSDDLPKLRYRVESATDHLAKGIHALSSLGPLRLSNVSLCTKVDGFGDFTECSASGLEPGKPVVLYVEVENATAEPIQSAAAQGGLARRGALGTAAAARYVTELHGRYEILDANQRTIVSRTLPVSSDTCRNQRRDFYISYVLYMPEQIAPGAYTLELTIEDKKGGKFGNAVVDFRIR